jgi:hypothetical protein
MKTKQKYVVVEYVRLEFEVEAENSEDAREKYFEKYSLIFNGWNIESETSEMTLYLKTKEGLIKQTDV